MHKKIETKDAPHAIGPYSQAIEAKGERLIFISGQIPLCPKTMKIENESIIAQTRQVLDNLLAIVGQANATIKNVVKTTVYLKNMNDFASVNEVYQQYFKDHHPARVCVEVARLPRDVLVEIDAILVV